MNNKLLLKHLVLLTITTVSAFADVDIYGKLIGSLEGIAYQNSSQPSVVGVVDNNSYFGIHGSEYITPQTNFIWQVEQLIDFSSGQSYSTSTANGLTIPRDNTDMGKIITNVNQLGSSDSFIGIQSTWGMIRLGNLSSYMRANMYGVDFFNYNAGRVNGLSNWSRVSNNMILPNTFAYNSSSWRGFTLGFQYSFDNLTNIGSSVNNNIPVFGVKQNGNYSGGIYSYGIAWQYDKFKINIGSQIWASVGAYNQGISGINQANIPTPSVYSNAYANRVELSYNDPNGIFIGAGVQITDGLGWYNWANSGGSFNNYIVNYGYNDAGLNQPEYQTQEFAISAGYNLGRLTPKIAYAYGNNMMYGGSMAAVLSGVANQIPDSGYEQLVAELDIKLTPEAFAFINYGQIWYGSTLQNITYCGLNCNNGNPVGSVSSLQQAFTNQSTFAIGMSYLF